MDKYFPVVSKSSSIGKTAGDRVGRHTTGRYQPYELHHLSWKKPNRHDPTYVRSPFILTTLRPVWRIQGNSTTLSSSILNRFLLGTLAHPSNPITHSDIGQHSGTIIAIYYDFYSLHVYTDFVFSTSTGHQVSDVRRNRRLHFEDREHKLVHQRNVNSSSDMPQIFRNVRVYINGFLDNTTDIEMKRIITQSGGQIAYV